MVYQSPHRLTPPCAPQSGDLQKAVNSILLQFRLSSSSMENLSIDHLHRLFRVHLSDGSQLIFKTSPSSNTLLLRHEQQLLHSEAAALTVLAKSRLPIPMLLKYESNATKLDSPVLLTTYLPGLHYVDALSYLSHSEKTRIETQLQSMRSIISQHRSSSFGPLASGGLGKVSGAHKTWRQAFTAMLEGVLQDGEDMMVNISYFEIREALSRWGSSLDAVTEARLVILGLEKPDNVLIERKTNTVVGLLDFGMAVWGDPAIGSSDGNSDIRSLL